MSAQAKKLWDFDVHQGTVLYLALEDDYKESKSRMFMMYGVEDSEKLHFQRWQQDRRQGLMNSLNTL